MSVAGSLRGLANRLRPRAPVAPEPPVPLRLDLTFVLDHEIADSYPGAIRRRADIIRWHDRSVANDGFLTVLPVDGAIVTRVYLPIDPARGIAILNQTFDNLPVTAGMTRAGPGDGFSFESDHVVDVPGRVVVIGGVIANNYFHCLLNWMTRFTIVELLAPELYHDPEVRFLVDAEVRAEPFLSMLKAMKVPLDRVLWSDHAIDYRIEHAYLPSFLHEGLICGEVFAALAARIRGGLGIASPEKVWRRVWISREHAPPPRRRVANFDAIAPLLDAHGFERVALETLSFPDQVRLFVEAEIVAGAHGAGFANLIFTSPGCRALIVEKDFTLFLGIANLFLNLARETGRACELVPSKSLLHDDTDYAANPFLDRHFADSEVDPMVFAEALDRAVRGVDAPVAG